MFRIHTATYFETARFISTQIEFKRIKISFTLYNIKGRDLGYMLLAFCISRNCNQLNSDSIIKSLLINYDLSMIGFSTDNVSLKLCQIGRYYFNVIPTRCDKFLPGCNILSNLIIVGTKKFEAI